MWLSSFFLLNLLIHSWWNIVTGQGRVGDERSHTVLRAETWFYSTQLIREINLLTSTWQKINMTESLAFKKLAAAPEATYILLWSPEQRTFGRPGGHI